LRPPWRSSFLHPLSCYKRKPKSGQKIRGMGVQNSHRRRQNLLVHVSISSRRERGWRKKFKQTQKTRKSNASPPTRVKKNPRGELGKENGLGTIPTFIKVGLRPALRSTGQPDIRRKDVHLLPVLTSQKTGLQKGDQKEGSPESCPCPADVTSVTARGRKKSGSGTLKPEKKERSKGEKLSKVPTERLKCYSLMYV